MRSPEDLRDLVNLANYQPFEAYLKLIDEKIAELDVAFHTDENANLKKIQTQILTWNEAKCLLKAKIKDGEYDAKMKGGKLKP